MTNIEHQAGPEAAAGAAGSEPASGAPDRAKRRQILAGARAAFLEHGFDGASMGDIVAASGVSKATVYAYFASKEALFEALILDERLAQWEQAFALDPADHDVAKVLTALGLSFMSYMARPETIQIVRLVIAAAAKFPRLGQVFFEAGPALGHARLKAYLEAQVAAGVLRIESPEAAAGQFIELTKVGITVPMLMGVIETCPQEKVETNVRRAVEVFMRVYGVA